MGGGGVDNSFQPGIPHQLLASSGDLPKATEVANLYLVDNGKWKLFSDRN